MNNTLSGLGVVLKKQGEIIHGIAKLLPTQGVTFIGPDSGHYSCTINVLTNPPHLPSAWHTAFPLAGYCPLAPER